MSLELTPEAKACAPASCLITHRGCVDGFSSLFVLYLAGMIDRNTVLFTDVPSAKRVPDLRGKTLICADIAYQPWIIEELLERFERVVFLDHHVTIKSEIAQIKNDRLEVVYDVNACGAVITWRWCFGDKVRLPTFLKYVNDNDLGHWLLRYTRAFTTAFEMEMDMVPDIKHLKEMKRLLEPAYLKDMVKRGELYYRYRERIILSYLPYSNERKWGPYNVSFVNVAGKLASEIATRIAKENPKLDFSIAYNLNLTSNKWVYSLRSKTIDVGEIAKKRGGGGHRLAAAFTSSLNPNELIKTDP
jgi:oligoribonuclease NrnB/cAMP/cGMP phosphodiesterase (DHH superfamily)